MPRMVGPERGVELLRTGRPVGAQEACAMGWATAEVAEDVVQAARGLIAGHLEGKVSLKPVSAEPMAVPREWPAVDLGHRSGVIDEILGLRPDDFDVVVHEGIVLLAGTVADEREVVRLERLVGSILGVSRVDSKVTTAG